MTDPVIDRAVVPDGYGVPESMDGVLSWGVVVARLEAAKHYWMVTTRPDGRPHVVPRWGAWVDGAFYYDGSPDTVHVKNLARNPACVLHLESGSAAVILEGTSGRAKAPDPDLGRRISEAFAKYAEDGYAPGPDAWDGPDAGGLCRFVPAKALAWTNFPDDVTRFTFSR